MGERRRTWLMGALLVLLAAALAVPGISTAGRVSMSALPANTRAMWLWGDSPAAEVVDWAAANGVSEIFVYVSPAVLTNGDLQRLQDMRMRADALKIKLSALGGDSAWVTNHKAALAWQATVLRTKLFAGIHLDVEPYLSDGWSTDLRPPRSRTSPCWTRCGWRARCRWRRTCRSGSASIASAGRIWPTRSSSGSGR